MCVYACTYVSMLLHGYTYTHAHICLYMSIPGVYNRAVLCSQSCCVESALSGLYANETSDLWSNLRQPANDTSDLGTYGGEQKNNYYKFQTCTSLLMYVQHSKQRVKADRGCAKRDSGQQVRHIGANNAQPVWQVRNSLKLSGCGDVQLHSARASVSADMTDLLSRVSLRTASISFDSLFAVLDGHQEGWPPT